jgi:hypothetical protein
MLKVRKAEASDLNFIRDSTYRSIQHALKKSDEPFDLQSYKASMNLLHKYWEKECAIAILCDDEYPEVILSYIIYKIDKERIEVWWTYTKKDYRRAGFVKLLLEKLLQEDLPITYFFPVKSLKHWMKHGKGEWRERVVDKLQISPAYLGISRFVHGGGV